MESNRGRRGLETLKKLESRKPKKQSSMGKEAKKVMKYEKQEQVPCSHRGGPKGEARKEGSKKKQRAPYNGDG